MMYRRFPRAHNGDGPMTVARCAAARDSRVMRHDRRTARSAQTGDDHVS